ncbi:MAG: chlorite dismutase family protein [Phreatobacter sp.]|uniref:chlorite dismutase family protein n=1 Tax=Phreatobacter sp. TaxID=1966341 RepID=UPI0027349325|nr:chlorite dismutase family protein [Phreatobacter sp.]MDP2803516.1 chlorite dismutase family protein [Phreatobacter sp.]
MTDPLAIAFTAGETGPWRIAACTPVTGTALPAAPRLAVTAAGAAPGGVWTLIGTTSNTRYATRAETDALAARQQGLGRPAATCAALIPIRKSAAWWALAQDERRDIFEARSRHTAIGMDYLPQVARRLHHCRDLGGAYDFLTWFEYASDDAAAFERMVARLRATEEWRYVEAEMDLRLERD